MYDTTKFGQTFLKKGTKITAVSKGNKLIGFKIGADKLKFLNNFIISDIKGSINYDIATLSHLCSLGEMNKIDNFFLKPDTDHGIHITFIGKLYGKSVVIKVTGPDDCEFDEYMSLDWREALGIILIAFHKSNNDGILNEYCDLPELHDNDGVCSIEFDDIKRLYKQGKVKEAINAYNFEAHTSRNAWANKVNITKDQLKQKIADYNKDITIRDYMKSVKVKRGEAVYIEITRDWVVYQPRIVKKRKIKYQP